MSRNVIGCAGGAATSLGRGTRTRHRPATKISQVKAGGAPARPELPAVPRLAPGELAVPVRVTSLEPADASTEQVPNRISTGEQLEALAACAGTRVQVPTRQTAKTAHHGLRAEVLAIPH